MKKISLLTSIFLFSTTTWAKDTSVTLGVPSMNCMTCPYTVQKALEKVEGVHNVEVSYATKEATVRFDDTKTNILMLIEATTNAGYSSSVKTDATNER